MSRTPSWCVSWIEHRVAAPSSPRLSFSVEQLVRVWRRVDGVVEVIGDDEFAHGKRARPDQLQIVLGEQAVDRFA